MARGGKREGAGRKAGPGEPTLLGADGQPMREATASAGKFLRTTDAFVNYPANLGLGANNILTSSSASFNPLSRIRTIIEWMYRQQFVCRNAVNVIPEDMTRQGVDITGPMKPKDLRRIENYAMKQNIWGSLRQCLMWARLYGGCVGLIVIKGQKPEDPFRIETVGKDQFQGILPLDRWMIEPSLELLETSYEYGAKAVGLPQFYRVTADAPALPRMKMHHSRLLRLTGADLPYWQSIQENLWGLSVLETIQDRITAFDLGSAGAAQLINKSFIRTFKIEGLKELIASNDTAYQGLLQLVQIMTAMQGIEGMTLMDTKDEYEGHEHGAFSGIAEILNEFRQQLSGALQMPMTKLFGQAPAGMNATGESDMRNYYDMIKSRQEADLKYPLTIVYQCLAQSVGAKWDDECGIEFRPLWQPTEVEKAEIAKSITETVLSAEEKGTISTKTAMKELKQQSKLTGVWSNITEEDIEAATDIPVPAAELAMPGAGGPPGAGGEKPPMPGSSAPKPAAPAKKPAPAGAKDAAYGNGFYDPDNLPNVTPYPGGTMPHAVTPGSRPFEDSAPGPTHLTFHGLPLHVENQRGTMRKSRDPKNPWQAIMQADYGYVVGTGSAEGPHEGMDVFLGPDRESQKVFVINQKDIPTGHFDEHKVMLGFSSRDRAISAYVSSYSDLQGVDRIMGIIETDLANFKHWLRDGDLNFPYVA